MFGNINNWIKKLFSRDRKMPPKVSLWLAMIFIVLAFAGGVLAGGEGGVYLKQPAKSLIKGVDATSTSTSGSGKVVNTDVKKPDYLSQDVDFNMYWQVWNYIKEKYYDKNINDTQLFYGSLSGLVAAVGDPYSVFLTPSGSNQFQEDLQGKFEGIGAEIGIKNSNLIIIAPLPDTPAEKAGLKPKDTILKINGTSTQGMRVDEAVSLIRGKKGTKVILNIFRDGSDGAKDYEIVRDAINVKSVTWEIKNDNIAYIKVRQFNDDTMPLFNKAIADIVSKANVKGIILDLRNNPGGYLQTAIDLAGQWLGGQVVVSEKNRNGEEIKHVADTEAKLDKYKTVVLVDGGSASASEIVAGALQDWGKATIAGMKTFGKGSVQDLTDLPDGSSLKLTIAKWFTPKGRSIDEQGIEPDVKIDLTEEDYNKDKDPQLDKAVEIINQ